MRVIIDRATQQPLIWNHLSGTTCLEPLVWGATQIVIATHKKTLTLEEYLRYDDGTDAHRYELWNGQLIDMGAESDINIVIGSLLSFVLSQIVPYYCVRRGTEICVEGELANTRFPDLLVVTEEGAKALAGKKRSMVTLDMPAPALVVEVVSNSEEDARSRDRDYINKRQEYAIRNIPEYWIVDPVKNIILVLTLKEKRYQEQQFSGQQKIKSMVFPTLDLVANQVLEAGL